MPGVTGYPALGNSDPMNGPAQIIEQSAHWDDIEDRSYASASNFPAAGATYPGRLVYARDTDTFYINDAGTWTPVGQARQSTTVSSFASGYAAGVTNRLSKVNGQAILELQFTKQTALVAANAIITLPTGYRPLVTKLAQGATTTGAAPGFINYLINTDGTINILYLSASGATTAWITAAFDV